MYETDDWQKTMAAVEKTFIQLLDAAHLSSHKKDWLHALLREQDGSDRLFILERYTNCRTRLGLDTVTQRLRGTGILAAVASFLTYHFTAKAIQALTGQLNVEEDGKHS